MKSKNKRKRGQGQLEGRHASSTLDTRESRSHLLRNQMENLDPLLNLLENLLSDKGLNSSKSV